MVPGSVGVAIASSPGLRGGPGGEGEGVHASSVTLIHDETDDVEVLDLVSGTYSKRIDNVSAPVSDNCSLEMVLYVKG